MRSTLASHGAVPPGADLGLRARDLRRMHDAVLSGSRSRQQEGPRDVVLRSWRRVMASGLDADHPRVRDPLPWADVERRRRDSPLSTVMDELRAVLTSVADASSFLMVVTDADGVVLWREGSSRVRCQADTLGFSEGARWTEETVGTNAIGTALAEAAPVELFSAEHFENAQHPWYCSARPMHDPRSGDLLGVVDLSGPAMTLHPAVRVLVESGVRLAEARLAALHREHLERIRRDAEPMLAGSGGPLLVVDDQGWVAHHAGLPRPGRIAVPEEAHPLVVPGLGLCVPERLAGGWLVRQAGADRRMRARLETDERVLAVITDSGAWRTVLTARHAQLLEAIARAGADGTDAASLSRAVFGDAEHVVTVRAEISRLRRAVGALVTAQPYRIADGVAIEVVRHR